MTLVSQVTVFVIFSLGELPAAIDVRSAAVYLSREEPRWSIGVVGHESFRLGRYDRMPVLVTLQQGAFVMEESRSLSIGLSPVTPAIRRELASGTARFELRWNLGEDREVAPETALLVVACAQALARLTNGVVLAQGPQVIDREAEFSFSQAYTALLRNQSAPSFQ